MEDILLSVSSPPEINFELFTYWVEGKTADETTSIKVDQVKKSGTSSLQFHRNRPEYISEEIKLIRFEVSDQFRAFQLLEHYLSLPPLLKSQSLCYLSSDLQLLAIEKYWALDDIFVRELLNKRLTKSRKDLEDVSETTALNLRRVTRQFDNIKRIYSAFEDSSNLNGNVQAFIGKNFLLSSSLSKRYACIVFLMYSKFNLMAKRRIQKISCERYEFTLETFSSFSKTR